MSPALPGDSGVRTVSGIATRPRLRVMQEETWPPAVRSFKSPPTRSPSDGTMNTDVTAQIFQDLLHGSEADRSRAIAALSDAKEAIDRARLRLLILDALEREYYPGREDQEQDDSYLWTRSWSLNVLSRICDDDKEAAQRVRRHLDPQVERSYWVQYWTLDGLVAARASDLPQLARQIRDRVDRHDPLVTQLAAAILASSGDREGTRALESGIDDPDLQWATLRALRVVPIPALFSHIAAIVGEGEYSDATYDAIVALSAAPPGTAHAERAARTLSNFVATYKRSALRDGERTAALKGLGRLKDESAAPLLIDQLADDNPGVAREAAVALERTVGIQTAAARVVEAAGKAGPERIARLARALRWMNRDALVEELESLMVSGRSDEQEVARQLMSEIGGAAAFEKLRARTSAVAQYTAELEKAEEKIRNMFEASLKEARTGFKISSAMDIAVFALGYALIAGSAWLILDKGGTLDSWVGIGVTGGTGVLGVLYSLLIAKPRKQIVNAVDHLMKLKIIFLAYLRQLHQADQAYTRKLLEDEPLAAEQVDRYAGMVRVIMQGAVEQLRELAPQASGETPSGNGAKSDTQVAQSEEPSAPIQEP